MGTFKSKEDLAAYVRESTERSGVPEKVNDPAILARWASLAVRGVKVLKKYPITSNTCSMLLGVVIALAVQ